MRTIKTLLATILMTVSAWGYGQVTITGFSPASSPVGTLVTITGTNLSSPSAFTIGGVSAIVVSDNGTTLVGMVMPGATTGAVSVTTSGGTATAGSNYTVTPTPHPAVQQGSKLRGTGATLDAYQGSAVSVSADGNTALIGGLADSNGFGAVWIFIRSGGTWVQQGPKLLGTGASPAGAAQGTAVALSADGNTALVGGAYDSTNIGGVWVFTRSGGTWTQQGPKLLGTDYVYYAEQGMSVSLSADGNTAIVGGPEDSSNIGAAWIFTRSGGTWTQPGPKLVGTGAVGNSPDQGSAVALSADGSTAIVGGSGDNGGAGAVWVFTRSGSAWTQQGFKLVGTGAAGPAAQGTSVSLSADGNTAMVGAYGDNSLMGAAWVYTRSGGIWTQQGSKLVGTGAVAGSGSVRQGYAVGLSADGNTAVVGGPYDANDTGAVWVYTRSGSSWTQQGAKLVGSGGIGGVEGIVQGYALSLSADGSTAVSGGLADNNLNGATWVFVDSVASFTAGPDQIICQYSTATMAAVGTGSWSASIANPASVTFTNSSSASSNVSGFTAPGTYSFFWTTGGGSDSMTVTVTSAPVISFSNTILMTSGTAGATVSSANGIYQAGWDGPWNGMLGNVYVNDIHNSGVYCFLAVDTFGCTSAACDSVNIPLCHLSGYVTEYSDTSSTDTFQAHIFNGTGSFTYLWSAPPFGGIGPAIFTVSPPGPACVQATDSIGCVLNVCDTPSASGAGPDQTICQYSTAVMAAIGTGTWSASISNPASVTFTNTSSASSDVSGFTAPGTYSFFWTTGAGSDTMTVMVNAKPNAGADQNITENATATMAATGTGIWTALASNPATATISSSTSATTTITGFSVPGIYSFIWSNGGCSDTANVVVTGTLPYQSICINSIATMSATGIGTWFALSSNPVVTLIDSPSSPTTGISGFAVSGTYGYVYNPGDTALVFVQPAPAAPILSLVGGSCLGHDSLGLTGVSGAAQLSWFLYGTTIDTTPFLAITVAGGNGTGTAADQVSYPYGLYFDGSGNIYVSERNSRIQKFPAGSTSMTNGVIIAGGNGLGSAANQFDYPEGIFVDGTGNVYVADMYNNRIQKFPAGSTSSTNGVTVAGGNGSGNAANQFESPEAIFIDAGGNLYVADAINQRIQKFPPGSTSATNGVTIAGGNGQGNAANQFYDPDGVYVDGSGNLYVADYANNRIQQFPAGSTSATNGTTVAGGNGIGNAANQFAHPTAVYLDNGGNIYVSDAGNDRVQKFPAGSTSATNGVTVAGGNGPGSAISQLWYPVSIYVDSIGAIYVADQENDRIQKWNGTSIDSFYTPTLVGSYTASYISSMDGCTSLVSDTITVNSCSPDSVWPGDANNDRVVDNTDLLPIGLGYDSTGPARLLPLQTIVWQADAAADWADTFTGAVNYKHADCNGDGTINADDTLAIVTNFGDVHFKDNGSLPWRTGLPVIYPSLSIDTASNGDTLFASIILGDSALPGSNVYGVAFTLNYDPIVIDSSQTSMSFGTSWLGNASNAIHIYKNMAQAGMIKAAVTRIDHVASSGYGTIAVMRAIVTTDNIDGKNFQYYLNRCSITDVTIVDAHGNIIPVNEGTDSDVIAFTPLSIADISLLSDQVSVYPNPAGDLVSISCMRATIQAADVLDVLGETVRSYSFAGAGRQRTLDLQGLSSDIYYITVKTSAGTVTKKVLVSR